MTNTFYNLLYHTIHIMDPWSSGYDVSLTRRRSPVRLRVGPLLIATLTVLLLGCGSVIPDASMSIELDDGEIRSNTTTTLSVAVKNSGGTPLNGDLHVTADGGGNANVTHPEPSVLDTTLYPGESLTRRFTVTAVTDTRRTDYEITAAYQNSSQNHTSTSTVVSVVR